MSIFTAAMTASLSATSMSTAARVGFCGSTNARMLVTRAVAHGAGSAGIPHLVRLDRRG